MTQDDLMRLANKVGERKATNEEKLTLVKEINKRLESIKQNLAKANG